MQSLTVQTERLALTAPFRISRGVKTHAEVVVATLAQSEAIGRGECVPYGRFGETPATVTAMLNDAARQLSRGKPVRDVLRNLPPGAARNALDCAAWDLEARLGLGSVEERIGRSAPGPMATAVTIGLNAPEAMRNAARGVVGAPLIKVKLDADAPAACLAAVAEGAPGARLIVDPNEGWTLAVLQSMAEPIAALNVAMVEQPLPAGQDAALEGLDYPVPICADEGVHTSADLARIAGRYQMVNIKLDKAGGLTEALAMTAQAKALGLGVLAGCMVSSSLSIAPQLWIAAVADAADLDGPWWIAQDRLGGCRVERGVIYPPSAGFWGEAGARPEPTSGP